MKRVAIIGCPGSGKTTSARKLAQIMGLPLIHLDLHYYDQTQDYPNNKDAWRTKVTELVEQNTWIIDGNYKSTFDIRLPRADTIIFLDYPKRVVLWRMLKRRMQYQYKRREDMPDSWREHISWDFFKFVWSFNRHVRPGIVTTLEKHKPSKVIVFLRNQAETDAFLASRQHV